VSTLRKSGLERIADLDAFIANDDRIASLIEVLRTNVPDDRLAGSVEDWLTQLVIVDRDDRDDPGDPIYNDAYVPILRQARDAWRHRTHAKGGGSA
jgi:hypothetical protein